MPQLDPPFRASSPVVGVVTVSYGSSEALQVFLQSLRENDGREVPIVIVDNKPDHESVEQIAKQFEAHYLPLQHNPGYGAGMNAGVQVLNEHLSNTYGFDAYFFCNPDLRIVEPTTYKLANLLLQDDRAGSIGPRLLNLDNSVYPSARSIPSLRTGIGHALLGRIWPNNPWSNAYKNSTSYSARRSTGSLSGAAVMVRREVFEEINGWDEGYFMHFEDIDLGWRIGNAGYINIFEPEVSIEHSGGHSTKKHSVVVEKAMTASAIRFMRKLYSGLWKAPIRWALILGLRIRGAIKVRAALKQ